jgi:hypothetical protein
MLQIVYPDAPKALWCLAANNFGIASRRPLSRTHPAGVVYFLHSMSPVGKHELTVLAANRLND